MKILITGANGLLGSNLCCLYANVHEVYATSITKPSIPNCKNYKLDITDEKETALISKISPDLVIHCAALVNVDYCEEHESETELVNTTGTKNIAKEAAKTGIFLIHISTDAVFDGAKGNYSEEDAVSPINVYAKSKLRAEEYIKEFANTAVIRTNIYGWNRTDKVSLAEWIINKLKKKEIVNGFKDVYFTPILVNNLAEALLEVYDIKYHGILNITGSEACSKYQFAKMIAKVFNFDENLIKPISVDQFNFKAKRAKNMSLNINKAKTLLKTKLLNIEDGLTEFKSLQNTYLVKLKSESSNNSSS